MATPDDGERRTSAIPPVYRLGAVFVLGAGTGGMFFNLLSDTIGYLGVAVAAIAGLLIVLAGLVAGAPRSWLAHAAVPVLLLLTPLPVLFAARTLPTDSRSLDAGVALPATLIVVAMGVTAAHLCNIGALDVMPKTGWLFACVATVNAIILIANWRMLSSWVLLAADGAVLLAAATWFRRRRSGLLTTQCVMMTTLCVVHGVVILGWAKPLAHVSFRLERVTHVYIPLSLVLIGVGVVLIAVLTSQRVRSLGVEAAAKLMSEPTVATQLTRPHGRRGRPPGRPRIKQTQQPGTGP